MCVCNFPNCLLLWKYTIYISLPKAYLNFILIGIVSAFNSENTHVCIHIRVSGRRATKTYIPVYFQMLFMLVNNGSLILRLTIEINQQKLPQQYNLYTGKWKCDIYTFLLLLYVFGLCVHLGPLYNIYILLIDISLP